MSTAAKLRKRVIAKVWQKDGLVFDNLHEIEWLERQGWEVECSEKLLHDDTTGVSYLLYVLTAAPDKLPALDPFPGPVLQNPKVEPNKAARIPCPAGTVRVLLALSGTRGRVVVQPLVVGSEPEATGLGSATATPFGGFVTLPGFGAGPTALTRPVAILCLNDVLPALALPGPVEKKLFPEGEPARMTGDAYFLVHPDFAPANPNPVRIFREEVPPGETINFYLEFVLTS